MWQISFPDDLYHGMIILPSIDFKSQNMQTVQGLTDNYRKGDFEVWFLAWDVILFSARIGSLTSYFGCGLQ